MSRDILDVATPHLRPPWSKPHELSDTEFAVLAMAIEADPLHYRSVYYAYGERAWSILNRLKRAGAMDHPGYNRWQITEKGRVAAALARAQENRRNITKKLPFPSRSVPTSS